MQVDLTVNGSSVSAEVEPRTLLVQFLRDHVGLTGTNVMDLVLVHVSSA